MGQSGTAPGAMKHATTVERASDRAMIVTRMFDAPPRTLFAAWTRPELFMRWWAPRSMGVPMLACEMDVRVGGSYRITFGHDAADAMAFFGRYLEVVPDARLVWTNEEGGDCPVTTVRFAERDGGTLLTYGELHATKEACDESLEGVESMMPEQFGQLDALLGEG